MVLGVYRCMLKETKGEETPPANASEGEGLRDTGIQEHEKLSILPPSRHTTGGNDRKCKHHFKCQFGLDQTLNWSRDGRRYKVLIKSNHSLRLKTLHNDFLVNLQESLITHRENLKITLLSESISLWFFSPQVSNSGTHHAPFDKKCSLQILFLFLFWLSTMKLSSQLESKTLKCLSHVDTGNDWFCE